MDHNNFAKPSGTAEDAEKTVLHDGAVGATVAHAKPVQTKDEKALESASGLQGLIWLPYQLQLATMISFAMRKMGLVKSSAIPRSLGNSFVNGLETTPIARSDKLVGNMVRTAVMQHQAVGNTKRTNWLNDELADRSDRFFGRVGERIKSFFQPLRDGIANFADRHGESDFGKFVQRRLDWVARDRSKANHKGVAKHIAGIPDLFKKPAFGKDPLVTDPALKPLIERAESAQKLQAEAMKLTGDARAAKLAEAKAVLEDMQAMAKTLLAEGKVSVIARDLAWKTHVSAGKALAAMETAGVHAAAVGGSLRKVLGNGIRMMGRTSWIAALVTAGTAVGIYIAAKTAQNHIKSEDATLKQMGDDIGDHNSPYLKEVAATAKLNKGRYWAAGGLQAAGEGMMMTTMGPSGGGIAEAGGQMALMAPVIMPEASKVLIKTNPALNAYATLKQAEQTGTPMSPQEKTDAVRQLVGAVPVVANKGGYYNRLAGPVAQKISEKNLSLRDTMQLITNNERFTALATEVKTSVDAAKAEQIKVKEQAAVAPEARVNAAPMMAKPAGKVSLDTAHYAGTLASQNLALAQ